MHYAFYGGSCKAKLKAPAAVVVTPVHLRIRESRGEIPRKLSVTVSQRLCQFLGTILLQEVEHCPTESRYTPRTPKCTMHYRLALVQLMAD
jgi:hypothetical protein